MAASPDKHLHFDLPSQNGGIVGLAFIQTLNFRKIVSPCVHIALRETLICVEIII